MQWSPGQVATLYATFTDSWGQLIDPAQITVSIKDPNGMWVVQNDTPTRTSLGQYSYSWPVPVDAVLGLYRIDWNGMHNGAPVNGSELFYIAPEDSTVYPSVAMLSSHLRSRLGEISSLSDEENGSDTLFSNDEIAEILIVHEMNLDRSTLEGWQRKAARLSRMVDLHESGSERKLSQRYRQSREMMNHWRQLLADQEALLAGAMAGRVPGRVARLNRPEEPESPYPFSSTSDHIRTYPTHRLIIPAILA